MLIAVVAIALALYFWGAQSDTQQGEDTLAQVIQGGDIARCDRLDRVVDGVNQRTVCRNNIALNLAKEKGDVRYCKDLDDVLVKRDACEQDVLFEKAVQDKDMSVCGGLSDAIVRARCENNYAEAISLQSGDMNACKIISDEGRRQDCMNVYILRTTFTAGKESGNCSTFIGDAIQKDCALYNSFLSFKQPVSCFNMQTQIFRNFCLSEQARFKSL